MRGSWLKCLLVCERVCVHCDFPLAGESYFPPKRRSPPASALKQTACEAPLLVFQPAATGLSRCSRPFKPIETNHSGSLFGSAGLPDKSKAVSDTLKSSGIVVLTHFGARNRELWVLKRFFSHFLLTIEEALFFIFQFVASVTVFASEEAAFFLAFS